MTKIVVLLGTRPEVIKLYPVIKELKRFYSVIVVNTGQQRQLVQQALATFNLRPDRDLNVMEDNQSLERLTTNLHTKVGEALMNIQPDLVVVQGDTTTAFVGALEAFYHQIPVAHVEAGLRTNDVYSPFPEEINRRLISQVTTYHFVPTVSALDNLKDCLGEKVITGNTGIDTLLEFAEAEDERIDKRQVLVTVHRRESFGEPLLRILDAIKQLSRDFPHIKFSLPLHPNPNVYQVVLGSLGGQPNISFTQALEYPQMVRAMKSSYLILTDSGGIQEEAPSLGIPVVVLRDKTERPEGVEAGVLKVVGTQTDSIVKSVSELLGNSEAYTAMTGIPNPFGDGKASERISKFLRGRLWPN